jgi:hypothetical protein
MNTTVTNSDKRDPKRADIYEEFVLWSAMPPTERHLLGIETQQQFVEYHKIGINTPAAWKRRPDFGARVTELRREWAFDKSSDIIYGIYRAAIKGNAHSQKLWMQYFLGFSEKTETKNSNVVEVGVNDVRFIIDGLPEPERTKFHGYIREIAEFATMAKNARDADPEIWNATMPEDYKPLEPIKELPTAKPLLSYFSCDPMATKTTAAGSYVAAASCHPGRAPAAA